jgi:hypothetical protein
MSTAVSGHQLCGGSEAAVEQLLRFGRQLHQLSEQLSNERGAHNDVHRKALRVSYLHLPVLGAVEYSRR